MKLIYKFDYVMWEPCSPECPRSISLNFYSNESCKIFGSHRSDNENYHLLGCDATYCGKNVLLYSRQHGSISLVFLKWKQYILLKDHYISTRLHDITSQKTVIFLLEFPVQDFDTIYSLPLLSRGLTCQCGRKAKIKWQAVRTIQNKEFSRRPQQY